MVFSAHLSGIPCVLLSTPPPCSTSLPVLLHCSRLPPHCHSQKAPLPLQSKKGTYPAPVLCLCKLCWIITAEHQRAWAAAALPFAAELCPIRQHAWTSSKTKSKIGRMGLIREALSAFAADKPPRNGGREALFKAMLFHTAVSRSQTHTQ